MSVFKFNNYKGYLTYYIAHLPRRGRVEMGRIAKHLRVSSTLLSQILSGRKDFSLEQAEGIAQYLALSSLEADYFILLVHIERAGTATLKEYYKAKINKIRSETLNLSKRIDTARPLTDQERAVFYSSHIYAAIWLFTSLGDSGKSIEEIAERFDLSRTKIVKIVGFLKEVQLCAEKNGKYSMTIQSTFVEQGSPYLNNHYRNWRLKSIQQAENLAEKELMYTSVISISAADFDILREKMVLFVKDFLNTVHASKTEDIACLNLDFFWVRK